MSLGDNFMTLTPALDSNRSGGVLLARLDYCPLVPPGPLPQLLPRLPNILGVGREDFTAPLAGDAVDEVGGGTGQIAAHLDGLSRGRTLDRSYRIFVP